MIPEESIKVKYLDGGATAYLSWDSTLAPDGYQYIIIGDALLNIQQSLSYTLAVATITSKRITILDHTAKDLAWQDIINRRSPRVQLDIMWPVDPSVYQYQISINNAIVHTHTVSPNTTDKLNYQTGALKTDTKDIKIIATKRNGISNEGVIWSRQTHGIPSPPTQPTITALGTGSVRLSFGHSPHF